MHIKRKNSSIVLLCQILHFWSLIISLVKEHEILHLLSYFPHDLSIAFTETISTSFFFWNRQNRKLHEKLFHRLWKYIAIRKLLFYHLFFFNFLSLEHCIFYSLHIFLGVWAVLVSVWNLSRVTLHWHLRIYMLELSSSDIYNFDLYWKLYLLLFVQKNYNSLLAKIWFHGPLNFNTPECRKILFF